MRIRGRGVSRGLVAVLVLAALSACGADRAVRPVLKRSYDTEGPALLRVFAPSVAAVRTSVVQVAVGGDPVALGLVLTAGGEVLTKASEVRGAGGGAGGAVATLADGRELVLRPVAVDVRTDLALLRPAGGGDGEAAGWPAADWPADARVPTPGRWVIAPGLDTAPAAVGVVSSPPRELPPVRLGVAYVEEPGTEHLWVTGLQPDMGAAHAGVEVGDRLVELGGRLLRTTEDLREPLRDTGVGDTLDLVVERDGVRKTLVVTLMNRPLNLKNRTDFMNNMGNGSSRRRDGFDRVFQHDATISPAQCGGPLVDLDGRIVGLNIARAGRVEAYALPVDAVAEALVRLRAAADRAGGAADGG